MSARLTQVGVLSKGMDGRIDLVFGMEAFSTSPTLCYKEIQVSTKIRRDTIRYDTLF